MVVTMFASYGSFTDLCRQIIIDIAAKFEMILGSAEISPFRPAREDIHPSVDCLGSLAKTLLERDGENLLCIARTPDRAYSFYTANAGSSMIVCIDDPRIAALEKSQELAIPLVDAIRMTATSCSCLMPLLQSRSSKFISRDDLISNQEEVAKVVLAALKQKVDDANVADAIAVINGHRDAVLSSLERARSVSLRGNHSEKDLIALEGVLSPYHVGFSGQALQKIVVTRSLFFMNNEGHLTSDPPVVIDVTGRARMLVSGPYIPIPSGRWTFRLVIAFSSELVGAPFYLEGFKHELGAVVGIGKTSFSPAAGKCVVEISFYQSSPDTILEFRLSIERATFEGKVSVGYGEFLRLEITDFENVEGLVDWKPEHHSGHELVSG